MNPLHPRMHCAKFDEISLAVLENKILINFVNVFLLFHYYLPLKKGGALLLNKLESSSAKYPLHQVWLKLAQGFWRRRFFNIINVFSLFRNYFPLEKGKALHLNKLEFPLPKDALCQVWLKLAQWSGEEDSNFKKRFRVFYMSYIIAIF